MAGGEPSSGPSRSAPPGKTTAITSGVRRSRSLPFSATAGDTKTSASRAIEALLTHSMSLGDALTPRTDRKFNIRIILGMSAAPKICPLPCNRGREGLACSEVRLVGNRYAVVEQMLVVFGASFLMHRHLDPREVIDCRPRLIERVCVLNPERHLQRLAAVNQFIAFDHMQLLGMRRAEIVQIGLVVHSDGIHHQCIALVMADRLAVPGRLRVRRMRHVEKHPANLRIAR